MNICANNGIDHVKKKLLPVLQVLLLFFAPCYRKITYNGSSHWKCFGKKMCTFKHQLLKMPNETAVKIREKYLLKGSFLVKLQASSLMSKKITKIMHKSSLVINLFRRLTIQTTFKIDSIPCNCVCKFKIFSK